MRHCYALDLKDDPVLIARYVDFHRNVWPEVLRHIRDHGIVNMEIYRLETRLFMIMETDDLVFDHDRMENAARSNSVVQRWEHLMWQFQAPTPWTPPGKKWMTMSRIFDLLQSQAGFAPLDNAD